MASYGQEHGALLIAIEHRFYGKSQPLGDFSDLSLLSVDQALADYAAVIEHVSKLYNTTSNVVFGCSYIGSGAAWFRSKYSHLLSGAVASSPPVLAVADFFLYLDQVDQSIKEQFGDKCNTFIAAGYKQVKELKFWACWWFLLFYFVLFCFILFYFVLFCFVLFCTLFCFILFLILFRFLAHKSIYFQDFSFVAQAACLLLLLQFVLSNFSVFCLFVLVVFFFFFLTLATPFSDG